MEKTHFENIDPRPKRRKHKDNPYKIISVGRDSSNPHYYIKFRDVQNVEICVEVAKEIFDYFNTCELEDLSLLNEIDRHRDKTELSTNVMNILIDQYQDPLLDQVVKSQEKKDLRMAIMMLPDKQQRRLLMYYWGDMTYDQIAAKEECSRQAVMCALNGAKKNLKRIMEEL